MTTPARATPAPAAPPGRRATGLFPLVAGLVIAATIALLATPYPFLALVPAAGALAVAHLCRRPALGLYLIVLLMPFAAFRSVGPVKLHWLIAAILLVVAVLRQVILRLDLPHRRHHLLAPLGLFLGANLLAAYLSPHAATVRETLFRLAAAYVFIGLTLLVTDRRGFSHTIPRCIVWSVSASAFLGVLGFFFGVSLFAVGGEPGELARGVGGTTWSSSLSLMIVLTVPLAVHLLFESRSLPQRLLYLACILVLCGGLVTTLSRAGTMILLLVGVPSLLLYRHRLHLRHLGFVMAFLLAAMIAVILVTPPAYWQRQKNLLAGQDQSVSRRHSYLVVAADAIRRHPWLGSGPGAFRDLYAASVWARVFERKDSTSRRFAHNTYVEVLVGSGIAGLLPFLWLLGRVWRNFGRGAILCRARGDDTLARLCRAYQLAFLALLLYFFFHSGLDNKYFLLLVPLSQVAANLEEEAG